MINEDIINQYSLAYKRKQWVRSWRLIGAALVDWLKPYMKEMHKRGAYPISFLNLANYYTDKKDQGIATFFGARFVSEGADILKSIEKAHKALGEHPYDAFCSREFVHWKKPEHGVFLDYLYRIYEKYGSIQDGILHYMQRAEDPGEALYLLMKDGGESITLTRCRLIMVRLATNYGLGLDVWDCFDDRTFLPPKDTITEWYISHIFPADAPFDFEDLSLITRDKKPYTVMYEAYMLWLMNQADKDQIRIYMWRFCKTFYTYPVVGTKITAYKKAKTPYEYITDAAPIYDWDAQTLTRNPNNPTSGTWVDRKQHLESEEFKEKVRKNAEERERKRHAKKY